MQANENCKSYQVTAKYEGFVFETNQKIFYKLGFIPINLFPEKEYSRFVYEFSITTETEKRIHDPLVRNTIFAILSEFCSEPNNIIYYTCDSLDDKHLYRNRLFNKWFDDLTPDNFTKVDQKFSDMMVMSIIINHNNLFYNKIVQDLPDLFENIKSYK